MCKIDAQRAAMGRQLLHIDQLEIVTRRQPLDGDEREVREMLVIDGVELVLSDQPLEVRELQGDHALRLEQARHPAHEVVEVGHLRQHVVADDEIGALALRHELGRELRSEEIDAGGYALLDRHLGDVGRGLDAQDGNAQRQEVLQQVAVIARQLDDETVGSELQPPRDRLAVGLGVRDPGGRIGGKIGVLTEDVLRAHIFLELNEKALSAHQRMQREVRLHGVELVAREEALAQR